MDLDPLGHAPDPMSSDLFERTVFRPAPKRFAIEFLPPTKISASYQHGMRITPVIRGDRSSVGSDSSTSTHMEDYIIWRRWEDCLWLQDTLEKEYAQAARERRVRLAQGKGVKMFNGMYKQDMASSWESLPPGPVPDSVARDVHAYLPHLTKKGTFFRPKPATIEKRQYEFQLLIETLMSDEMPALVKEIRATRIITDFFGFWRRDVEIEEKRRKKTRGPRSSITSSVFSTYFSSASSSTLSPSSRRTMTSSHRSPSERSHSTSPSIRTFTDLSSTLSSRMRISSETLIAPVSPVPSAPLQRSQTPRARTDSSDSSSSEEVLSDNSFTANSSAPRIVEERPVNFNFNPAQGHVEPSPIRDSASENGGDLFVKSHLLEGQKSIQLRRRTRSADNRRTNRNWSVYASPIAPQFGDDARSQVTLDDTATVRESWQSTASGTSAHTYLDGMVLDLPRSPMDGRQSIASVATFMTTDSANAVLPRTPTSPESDMFMDARASIPISLSEFEITSFSSEDRLSMLDAFPRPLSYVPEIDSRPETPVAESDMPSEVRASPVPSRKEGRPQLANLTIHPPDTEVEAFVPESPCSTAFTEYTDYSFSATSEASITPTVTSAQLTTPVSSTSTTSFPSQKITGGTVSIKASHNEAIIMLKVPREVGLVELRQRLFNKFVGQEGVPLSRDFIVLAKDQHDDDRILHDEEEWRDVADYFEGSKLLLRIEA